MHFRHRQTEDRCSRPSLLGRSTLAVGQHACVLDDGRMSLRYVSPADVEGSSKSELAS